MELSHHGGVTGVSHGDELSRYALSVSETPVTSGDEIADHQVIIRGGQVEAVVVPLEEYRALKALEQREAELYWAVHEARYPSRPGDDVPDGKVYDSMDAGARGTTSTRPPASALTARVRRRAAL